MEEFYASDAVSFCIVSSSAKSVPFSCSSACMSLNTNLDGNVVATGDGMVVTVESDDTYAHIIEVECSCR